MLLFAESVLGLWLFGSFKAEGGERQPQLRRPVYTAQGVCVKVNLGVYLTDSLQACVIKKNLSKNISLKNSLNPISFPAMQSTMLADFPNRDGCLSPPGRIFLQPEGHRRTEGRKSRKPSPWPCTQSCAARHEDSPLSLTQPGQNPLTQKPQRQQRAWLSSLRCLHTVEGLQWGTGGVFAGVYGSAGVLTPTLPPQAPSVGIGGGSGAAMGKKGRGGRSFREGHSVPATGGPQDTASRTHLKEDKSAGSTEPVPAVG